MRQASVAPDVDDASAQDSSPSFAPAGGRFISRGRLVLRSAYWLASLLAPQPPERPTPVTASVARELDVLGFGAIRLVAASALLVGLITIFQAAYQLAPYGAEVVSARALAWFVAREIGPIVVAILVVARSAAAFHAPERVAAISTRSPWLVCHVSICGNTSASVA